MDFTVSSPKSQPGIKTALVRNDKIKDPDLLLEWAQEELSKRQRPVIEYTMNILDLSEARVSDFEKIGLGEIEVVSDDELDVSGVQVRITEVETNLDNPLDVKVSFTTKPKSIVDLVSDGAEKDILDNKTEWLNSEDVNLDDETTLEDWQDGNEIDGDQIADGTIQEIWFAKITEDQTSGGVQEYKVILLDPSDKSETSNEWSNCYVVNDAADSLSVNDLVTVAIPSEDDFENGEKPLIISGEGTGTEAHWSFVHNDGE